MAKQRTYKPVLVNLEPALVDALDDLARELGSTRAWLIRRALAGFLGMVGTDDEPQAQDEASGGRHGN